MKAEETIRLTAAEAARAIRDGRVTSEAVTRACLDRIAAREPTVRAWAHLDPGHALAQARDADRLHREGRGTGPLHGVPIGVKDIFDTGDFPTEYGSPAFAGRRPERDAVCVAALRNAGAVILGKTITTEFATLTPNVTRNPRDPGRTPGGSSSGSAAAVADLMVPAALGSQTIGSTIRPASFCGAFAMKPTYGLIPCTGVMPHAPSLDTVGIIARSLEDLALLAEVMQGHDSRDRASFPSARPPLVATAGMDWPLEPRFAVVRTGAWAEADPLLRTAFDGLVAQLGGGVVDVDLDDAVQKGLDAARIVQRTELATFAGPVMDRAPSLVSERLRGELAEGRGYKAVDYYAASGLRERLYGEVERILAEHGTILTPAAPGPAPKGLGATGNPVFNAFWTWLGVPCLTLPLLEADGMPLGVQLVAARRDDGRLLRTARSLEKRLAATV